MRVMLCSVMADDAGGVASCRYEGVFAFLTSDGNMEHILRSTCVYARKNIVRLPGCAFVVAYSDGSHDRTCGRAVNSLKKLSTSCCCKGSVGSIETRHVSDTWKCGSLSFIFTHPRRIYIYIYLSRSWILISSVRRVRSLVLQYLRTHCLAKHLRTYCVVMRIFHFFVSSCWIKLRQLTPRTYFVKTSRSENLLDLWREMNSVELLVCAFIEGYTKGS